MFGVDFDIFDRRSDIAQRDVERMCDLVNDSRLALTRNNEALALVGCEIRCALACPIRMLVRRSGELFQLVEDLCERIPKPSTDLTVGRQNTRSDLRSDLQDLAGGDAESMIRTRPGQRE